MRTTNTMKITKTVVIAGVGLLAIIFLVVPGRAAMDKHIPKETLEKVGPELARVFTFEPFSPTMPDHIWMKADEDKLEFLHFMKPVSEKDNKLIFIGDGIKGRFCAQDQPDHGKTGYVHFHSLSTSSGHKHGHGGDKGQEGFWLRHIAVADFDMMGMHFKPGTAMNFMPTEAPQC
jgi:hypothetical protein